MKNNYTNLYLILITIRIFLPKALKTKVPNSKTNMKYTIQPQRFAKPRKEKMKQI